MPENQVKVKGGFDSLYRAILEGSENAVRADYIGRTAQKVHPAQIKGQGIFMKWSVGIKGTPRLPRVYTDLLHLTDCDFEINHERVDRRVRGYDTTGARVEPTTATGKKSQGQKTPNVFVEGTIQTIGGGLVTKQGDLIPGEGEDPKGYFNEYLRDPAWTSLTYNPHKHPEYVKFDSVPDWWCSGEFPELDWGEKAKVDAKDRMERTGFLSRNPDLYAGIEVVGKREGTHTRFHVDEAILIRHLDCYEPYLIVKGIK